jgi:hypothetical protein
VERLLQGAIAGLALLALAGCADKKPDGPPVPIQVNGRTVLFRPSDPILKYIQYEMCRGTVCRDGHSVHLRIPNSPDLVDESALKTPYVTKDQIIVLPGDTFFVEADEGPNGPTNLHYVDKLTHPEKTLTVKLEQRPDLADGYGMRLTIFNPFGRALKYGASETRPGTEQDSALGLCPAPPRGDGLKNWRYPVAQVVLANFSFVPTEQAEACAP